MNVVRTESAVGAWLNLQREASDLTVTRVPLSGCLGWQWDGHRLRHHTGRYFSVVGLTATRASAAGAMHALPMVDQPEIGVLGFVVRRGNDGPHWLLQAKTEPGNVHGVQVGPSVQATRSNYERAHGGLATPLIDYFTGAASPGLSFESDSLQSEQGDRFLGKYNRNAMISLDARMPPEPGAAWRWFPARDVREALHEDFAINTDARSVMVCSPWRWLSDACATPFARWRGRDPWGEALFDSSEAPLAHDAMDALTARLAEARRRHRHQREIVALQALPDWQVAEYGIFPSTPSAATTVQAYSVHSACREVQAWHQPLLVGAREGRVSLLCARLDGVLQVLLRWAPEPGFHDDVQLGPSDIDDPLHLRIDWVRRLIDDGATRCHVAVRQSDEGGRFMHSIARYEVHEVPDTAVPREDPDAAWLTLAQVRELARTSGWLTNEARSLISLLLHWA